MALLFLLEWLGTGHRVVESGGQRSGYLPTLSIDASSLLRPPYINNPKIKQGTYLGYVDLQCNPMEILVNVCTEPKNIPFVTFLSPHTGFLQPSPREGPLHVCQLEDTAVAEQGTVSVWFGSASQVTSPELSTTMYLYSTTVPGAKLTATSQSGSLEVYCEALRVMASSVSQSPRAETSPELENRRGSAFESKGKGGMG